MFASNATLRKHNSELTVQMEELKTKNAELKSRNKELVADNSALVEANAELTSKMDGVRDELASEKAASAAQEGTLPVSKSVEPFVAKSAKKAKTKSSEAEGKVLVGFPAEGSA